MKAEKKISELTTNRMSVYLRCLNALAAEGARTVSSDKLALRFHLNSAQIRKDLAYFGEFGVRGVGYYVEELRSQLIKILGLNRAHSVGIIGAGRLGMALTDYYGFKETNFTVAALFDSDRGKIGEVVDDVEIFDINEFPEIVRRFNIDVAVIAVPAAFAEIVLEQVTASGIKAVMNFAPIPLKVEDDVKLKTIDLTTSLESLSYFLAQPDRLNGQVLKTKDDKKSKP